MCCVCVCLIFLIRQSLLTIFIRSFHQEGFDRRSFYSGDGDREFAREPRLVCCWSILVIESLGAMWTMLVFAKSPSSRPDDFADSLDPKVKCNVNLSYSLIATRHICQAADLHSRQKYSPQTLDANPGISNTQPTRCFSVARDNNFRH